MGYYKGLLKDIEEIKDKLTDMVIAREVSVVFGEHEEFEDICLFIREMYFDADSYDINEMCWGLSNFHNLRRFSSKKYKDMFKDIKTTDVLDFIKSLKEEEYEEAKAEEESEE